MKSGEAQSAGEQIQQLLHAYFDGLYQSSVEQLSRVFHSEAHYATASGGELLQLSMPEYFQRVTQRASLVGTDFIRTDEVLSVDILGPDLALAKVRCSLPGRAFTDLLSLIRVEGEWRIIAKVFRWDPTSVTAQQVQA